jgi:hypothetical protein
MHLCTRRIECRSTHNVTPLLYSHAFVRFLIGTLCEAVITSVAMASVRALASVSRLVVSLQVDSRLMIVLVCVLSRRLQLCVGVNWLNR